MANAKLKCSEISRLQIRQIKMQLKYSVLQYWNLGSAKQEERPDLTDHKPEVQRITRMLNIWHTTRVLYKPNFFHSIHFAALNPNLQTASTK